MPGLNEGLNDGYFVQANVFARRINGGPECGEAGSPPFPDCTPRLQGADVFVRTDLPVPVVNALGETDVEALFGIAGRQPDTPTFRYYEMAGVAHLTVHVGIELIPAGVLGPDPIFLEDLCAFPINSTRWARSKVCSSSTSSFSTPTRLRHFTKEVGCKGN